MFITRFNVAEGLHTIEFVDGASGFVEVRIDGHTLSFGEAKELWAWLHLMG